MNVGDGRRDAACHASPPPPPPPPHTHTVSTAAAASKGATGPQVRLSTSVWATCSRRAGARSGRAGCVCVERAEAARPPPPCRLVLVCPAGARAQLAGQPASAGPGRCLPLAPPPGQARPRAPAPIGCPPPLPPGAHAHQPRQDGHEPVAQEHRLAEGVAEPVGAEAALCFGLGGRVGVAPTWVLPCPASRPWTHEPGLPLPGTPPNCPDSPRSPTLKCSATSQDSKALYSRLVATPQSRRPAPSTQKLLTC